MKFLLGLIVGVLVYRNWDVVHPWIVSVLESMLNFIK